MPADIALPGPDAVAFPAGRAAQTADAHTAKIAKHGSKNLHARAFAALATQAEAASSSGKGAAPAARAKPGKGDAGSALPAVSQTPSTRPAGVATAGTQTPAGVPRTVPQKTAETKNAAQATLRMRAASMADLSAAALPPADVAPVSIGAGGGGGPPLAETGAMAPQAEGLPQAAASGEATLPALPAATAAPEQSAVAPASGGAPDGKPAEALPATGASAGEAAVAGFPDEVNASHDPAAQANAPAGQAIPDAVLSSSAPAALAEARETVALRVAHAAQDGVQTVSIELHPAELGHVGIELAFHDGGVTVQMTLARHETYEAFARDRPALQQQLEQQLAQSGLSLGSGGLDLRFGQKQDQPPAFAGTQATARARVLQSADMSAAPAAVPRGGAGLLNIIA